MLQYNIHNGEQQMYIFMRGRVYKQYGYFSNKYR